MDYQLIQKVNRNICVLKTPAGVQIWMKGKQITGASSNCVVCGKKIGKRPFFVPMAGESLPNPTERTHALCMDRLQLLPMQANTLLQEEGNHNDAE